MQGTAYIAPRMRGQGRSASVSEFGSGPTAPPLYSTIMASYILLKPIIVGVFSAGLAKTKEIIQ